MVNKTLLHKFVFNKGLTNEDIADKLGISRQSYQSRLNGKIAFKLEEIKTIQKCLKIGEDDLLAIFFAECVK